MGGLGRQEFLRALCKGAAEGEAALGAKGFKSCKPIHLLFLGHWTRPWRKGFWAMALQDTALPHGDFAFEDARSRWHLLGDGASCWETAAVCRRLNVCDGEEKGMLGEERMMLRGARMLRVLLGGKAQLCFTARPEIIPGGRSGMGSPWEQGRFPGIIPGLVVLAPPELLD